MRWLLFLKIMIQTKDIETLELGEVAVTKSLIEKQMFK